jgi:hypothetical protein
LPCTYLSIKLDLGISIRSHHLLHLLLLGEFKDVMFLDDLVVELGGGLVSGSDGFL